MNKAIFIDRDGTLIQEIGYLKMIEDLRFTYKATEALRIFQDLGFLTIVITNQSAVARGMLSLQELRKIHVKLKALALEDGARIDDIFFCPHLAEGRVAPYNIECDCRKPKPGMIQQAVEKHHLDLTRCLLVGDKPSDLELARNAGVTGVLVLTGYGAQTQAQLSEPVTAYKNLFDLATQMNTDRNADEHR